MQKLVNAGQHRQWRDALSSFDKIDVCHLPEYHEAYSLRFKNARASLWIYEANGEKLCYPFLLSPVILSGFDGETEVTEFNDISGIYGYSGPLSSTGDKDFLNEAWRHFDEWAAEHNVISEFIRFSTYVNNMEWAHPDVEVAYNRPVSIAILDSSADSFMRQLGSKTRNMIRKATKSNLRAQVVDAREGLEDFRKLYEDTMGRNRATDFFMYDDAYYDFLLSLPDKELLLFAVYQGNKMVAAAMGLVHRDMAFYHLGASTLEASRLGAGNLVLFEMARGLIKRGVGFFNIGGGRTTADDDPLFKFKKSNGTSVGGFYIGKRIIQQRAFDTVAEKWQTLNPSKVNSSNLQFYR